MRRITVGGEQLGAFGRHDAWTAPGFDDHVKLIFSSDGDVASALPIQMEHGIEWGSSDSRQARDYTPRAVRETPTGLEVDLDFVMHGDGPAASWAATAAVGDDLWFVGPKSSTVLPDDLDWIVLAGDETALPAIGRFLDERPSAAPARVVVTVESDVARQDLALRDGDTVRWIVGPADALEAAVRDLPVPDGTGYVWAASESSSLLPVRRWAQRELGLPKSHINITGYWHLEETEPAASGGAAGSPAVAPPPSPLSWLAVRAALQLGIVDAVADRPGQSLAVLAQGAGLDADRLGMLLPPLLAAGVFDGSADELRLGAWGNALVDDEHERGEFVGAEAEALLSLGDLAPALRARRPTWAARFGKTQREWALTAAANYAELTEPAEKLVFLLDGLVGDEFWSSVADERCLITGPGAVTLAEALASRLSDIAVCEHPVALDVLRDDATHSERFEWVGQTGAAAVVVAALAFAHRTDTEASALLSELRAVAPRAIVIESSRPDGLSPHAAEETLLSYAANGAVARDADALTELAIEAGWRRERVVPLGWGVEAIWLA